jgi:putative sugar O-methyltransferase
MGKLRQIFNYYFSNIYNLETFWKKNKNHKKIPEDLKKIFNSFLNSDSYQYCSKYWKYLNIRNLKQIMFQGGIKNYANNIALNYFTFLDTPLNMEKKMLKSISNIEVTLKSKIFKQNKYLGLKETDHLNRLIIKLYYFIRKLKLKSKLSQLSDKGFLDFNDHFLKINSENITTDKLVSLLDYKKIEENINLSKVKKILEIGAGSGRFTQTYLTFNKNTKYIICDIPPAIYISYKRLKKVFKNKKIKLCFDCNNYESFEKYLNQNEILFIFPHQIKLLKENIIDLTIAIDCIHEMDKKTIKYYFQNINNFSKFIYFSVWKQTRVPYSSAFKSTSNYLDSSNKTDYQIPTNWKLINQSSLYFPEKFDGITYEIKKTTKSKDKVKSK